MAEAASTALVSRLDYWKGLQGVDLLGLRSVILWCVSHEHEQEVGREKSSVYITVYEWVEKYTQCTGG
jgi:hypothetical protein